MVKKTVITGLWVLLLCKISIAQLIPLSGKWRFAVDPQDTGISEKWFTKQLRDNINLPGSMTENGKGDDITINTKWTGSIYDSSWFFQPRLAKYREPGNLKIPFWLTPAKHYTGVAWYQQEVTIPASWSRRHINLFLERVHIRSQVWIDDQPAGTQNSLSTPHEYDLTGLLTPGKHTITIRMDNRLKDMNVGPDSHSVTDHTQGNWNGITGRMFLEAGSSAIIDDVQVYPDIANKTAHIKVVLGFTDSLPVRTILSLAVKSFNSKRNQSFPVITRHVLAENDTAGIMTDLFMGDKMQTWNEYNPALYSLLVTVTDGRGNTESKAIQFGMRSFAVSF